MLISSCAVVCWMVTRCVGKLKAPVVKQKWFELERKVDDFSKPTGKGDQRTILLCVEGKNRAVDSNFSQKAAARSRSFEIAVSSLNFVYRKLRQAPENPPKRTK